MSTPPKPGHRVVVTGVGALTNIGHTAEEVWASMRDGRSGITHVDDEKFARWTDDQWAVRIGGQIKGFDVTSRIDAREAKRIDRFALLGMCAADEAVTHAGIDFSAGDPTRAGVVIGSGIGGITAITDGIETLNSRGPGRINPFTVPKLMINSASGHVSIRFGIEGPSSAPATACASSGHAIAEAYRYVRDGLCDSALAGGAEAAFTPLCVGSFMTMKALSTRNDAPDKASRPFDRDRDGFVLAEGAAVMVIESLEHARARGAEILVELVGCGATSDAHHITAPDPGGSGASGSMRAALKDAGLNPTDIDYINAHGTSTPLGDAAEVAAAGAVFGDHARASAGGRLLMSSTKSMHGHCLGASGGVESVACINAITQRVVAPTINCDNPDESFDIDFVPHEAREADIRCAMNNTFGFGGHNVTLIFKRFEA